MFYLYDTITSKTHFDSCHSIYVNGNSLCIFITERMVSYGLSYGCCNHLHFQKRYWMPIEIMFIFCTSFHFLPECPIFSSSFLSFFFLSMPDASIEILLESLLVRVIRGFKTTFHHSILEKSWRGRCRWVEWRRWGGWRKWRKRGENFSCRELPNSSMWIVRWVLMDYPSRRKPVNQRKFIMIPLTPTVT